MSKYTVIFAGNDLSIQDDITLVNHNFNDLPKRNIKMNKLARRDKSIITSSEYSQKEISVNLEVFTGTRAGAEDRITFLKSLVQAQNEDLTVEQGSNTISYTATMNEFSTKWIGLTAIVTLVFIASDPIGISSTPLTAYTGTSKTTASVSANLTMAGSATSYPTITVTFNSVSGASGKSVTVENYNTNQGIVITRTWLNSDILIVNGDMMEATVNGIVVDFTGTFPAFPAGAQVFRYYDDFTTSRNIDISITYSPKFV